MEKSVVGKLNDVIDMLRAIDESFVTDGVSKHFLEFVKSNEGNELQVLGNRAGLIHLARTILEVAERNVEGAHQHFDETGLVDRCDMTVSVSLKQAEWDNT